MVDEIQRTISFDLDDTLICANAPAEPCHLLGRLIGVERLRMGTRRLFSLLYERKFCISIYTSSLRPHWHIWLTFRAYGLKLDRIVNGDDHKDLISRSSASKVPHALGFAFHVDDSPISTSGFRSDTTVILVSPEDEEWVEKVLHSLQQ